MRSTQELIGVLCHVCVHKGIDSVGSFYVDLVDDFCFAWRCLVHFCGRCMAYLAGCLGGGLGKRFISGIWEEIG
jgi:hypothetical protein